MEHRITFNIDEQAATIYVMAVYKAAAQDVWNCFTKPELLEKWWLPKPWSAKTIAMDFRAGGQWHYSVEGLEGTEREGKLFYHEINSGRSFDFRDEVLPENKGNSTPAPNWLIGFTGVEEGMKLTINLHCSSAEELQQMIDFGFEKRLKDSLQQLRTLLQEQSVTV